MTNTPPFFTLLIPLLLAVMLCVLPITIQASTEINYVQMHVSGLVLSESGIPLAGVYVFTPDGRHGVSTNIDGRFSLSVPTDTHQLVFSLIGYQRVVLELASVTQSLSEIIVTLSSLTYQSGEVVITAARRSQLTGTVPVSVHTISNQDIIGRNATSLDQVLRQVPGVNIAQNQVNMRGSTGFAYGTGSRVLLLMDGVPLMGPDTNDIRFSSLPMSEVRQVEIIKGPGSALYGSGALGGVINLITKNADTDPRTDVRMFTGFYNKSPFDEWNDKWPGSEEVRYYTGLNITHSREVNPDLGFWVSAYFRDDFGYMENTNGYQFQGFSKISYAFSRDVNLDILGGFRHGQQRIFLYWNGINDALRTGRINLGGQETSGTTHTISQFYSFLPTLRHTVSDRFYYHIRGRFYGVASKPLGPDGKLRSSDKFTTGYRYGGEVEFTWMHSDRMSIITGATVDDIIADSEMFIGMDNERLRNQPEFGSFVQAEVKPARQVTVSGGLRFDAYKIDTQDVASKVSPKLNLAWSPTEALTLRMAYGQGFRVPAVSERFVNSRDYLPLEPNLGLRPEESVGYELGAKLHHRIQQNMGLSLDIVLFQNEYTQLIEPRFISSMGAFRFMNLPEASIRGVESTLKLADLSGKNALQIGYTFLDHKDQDDQPLPYRSDHQINLTLRYAMNDWLTALLDHRYLSKPDRVDTDFALFVPNAATSVDIHVTDVRLTGTIKLAENRSNPIPITIGVGVKNIFNYYHVERPAYLAQPRTFELTLHFSL